MILFYTPSGMDRVAYETVGTRVFQFMRRHSDDAYSSATMMALGAQVTNREAPFLVVDEYDVEVDRGTETKRGGIRTAGAVLRDGRVLLATHEKYRRNGYGASMANEIISRVRERNGLNLQFWVANSNIDGLRFLISQGLAQTSSTPNAQCYGIHNQNWPL